MNQLNFGVIGCGRISSRHIDPIINLDGARLIGVCDIKEGRANHYADKHDVQAYYDYQTLLANPDIDVVNICTPSGMHAEMGLEAIEAGKHVMLEKPMALSVSDADKLIAAANEAQVKLCIVLQNRYNDPVQKTYHMLRSGKIGRILLGNATVRWFRPQEYYDDNWHGTLAMDGGALMNQSIHHIDALQWLIDDEVESVFAYTGTMNHDMEAEDAGVAVLKFKGGTLANIEGSTITYPENLEGSVAIFGEKGSVKVGGTALNRRVIWKIEGELEHEREILTQEQLDPPSVYGYSHKLVIQDMIEAITNDREPMTNGPEGRKSVALVRAMYKSAQTHEPVILSEFQD